MAWTAFMAIDLELLNDARQVSMDPNPYEVTEPELLRGLGL
jgi:hypothetical protein